MESIDLKRLDLTIEESRDIINFIAQKRGISTEKLLSTIKPNLKHKNNEILTTKTQQELRSQKSQKTQQNLIKSQKNTTRTKKITTRTNKITTRTNKITKKLTKFNKITKNTTKT